MTNHTRQAIPALGGWSRLYAWGAFAAATSVILYLAAIGLYFVMPETPTQNGYEMLASVDSNKAGYLARQILWAIPNGLLMVTFFALTLALWHVDRPLAAVAGLVSVASWAIAVGWSTTGDGSFAMVTLADRYAAATTDTERAALAGAAETLMTLNDTPAAVGVLQCVGILLFGMLLVRSDWIRGFAWLGLATGVLGIVSESLKPLFGGAYAIYGLALFVWMAWLAVELWRRSNETARDST